MPYWLLWNRSSRPARRFTRPSFLNPGEILPVLALRAISHPSVVPKQICGGSCASPAQYAIPRSAGVCVPSYSQSFFPVSGSSARTRLYAVERYITPPITRGVDSERRARGAPPRSRPAPAPHLGYSEAAQSEPSVIGPGHLQLPHILRGKLLQRRIPGTAGVVTIRRPIRLCNDSGGQQNSQDGTTYELHLLSG